MSARARPAEVATSEPGSEPGAVGDADELAEYEVAATAVDSLGSDIAGCGAVVLAIVILVARPYAAAMNPCISLTGETGKGPGRVPTRWVRSCGAYVADSECDVSPTWIHRLRAGGVPLGAAA